MSVKLPEGTMAPVKLGRGGVHVPENKNTLGIEPVTLPTPAVVRIPMSMHIGAPCVPLVKKGDIVEVGQKIADCNSVICAPIFASVSGTVKNVTEGPKAGGGITSYVEIESDGEMRPWAGLQKPTVNSKEDFIQAARECGLVGLGGAGFPTAVKLNPPKDIDTLVVNGAECEPYITSDDYSMTAFTRELMDGILEITKWLEIENVVIGLEDNNLNVAEHLLNFIKRDESKYQNIKIMVMPTMYPKGAEKVLILSATGRVVPEGMLPHDVGTVVLNVSTIVNLQQYLETGMPLVKRFVTVDGACVNKPGIVLVPVGTSLRDLLTHCELDESKLHMVVEGGTMMGVPVSSLDYPVLRNNNAILALAEDEIELSDETDCIRCARCVDHCPMHLQPNSMMKAVKSGDTEALIDLGVMNCMECGCCSFGCPARIPLVQYFRLGKIQVRDFGGK